MKSFLVCAFFLVATFLAATVARAEDGLGVGAMTHLTGDFAAWGQAYIEGITLGQEQVNASGGIHGKDLTLEIEDTRFDSALTATASKKLLDLDRVPVAMVSTFTEAMVAGPMFQAARVPLLVFGDSGGKIETLGNFVFSTGTWVDGYALTASRFLSHQKVLKNVAIVATNNSWSQSTADSFQQDFERKGGVVKYRADLNPSDSDFRTVLQRIRGGKIDGVFAPITAGVVPFFEQARRIGLDVSIVAAGGAIDADVIKAAPEAVEGRYVTNSFLDPNRREAAEFLSFYRKKYGKDPVYPSVSARGFDGLMAIAHALRKAKSLRGEDIQAALFSVEFEGAGFHLKIDSKGTAALPVEVLRVKGGRLIVAEESRQNSSP
jgi:branched-chain amino acid transport system substrate-binding protein